MERKSDPELPAPHALLDFPLPPIRAEPGELFPPDGPAPPVDPEVEKGFEAARASVEAAKAALDKIPRAAFEPVARAFAPYAGLRARLRHEAGLQVATNASLKLYEILTHLRLAESLGRPARIRAFCNAELPGAFVATLNHYARTMSPHAEFDWLASSYYPEASGSRPAGEALGDQYGLYAANRERWLMGPPPNGLPPGAPQSGDLLDARVVPALADAVLARWRGGATLYTSDAGIDVSGAYDREEEQTALLNFGQCLCGLLALGRGGWFVMKQFGFARPFTRSLAALAAALFDTARLVKPRASAGANSEVYLVGQGFRGLDPELGRRLLARLARYRRDPEAPWAGPPLVAPGLARGVDAALLRAARQLERLQVPRLRAMAQAAAGPRRDGFGLAAARAAREAQQAWLAENPVRPLRPAQWLPAGRPGGEAGAGARGTGRGGAPEDRPESAALAGAQGEPPFRARPRRGPAETPAVKIEPGAALLDKPSPPESHQPCQPQPQPRVPTQSRPPSPRSRARRSSR